MPISKIKSITPRMMGDKHYSYEAHGSVNWCFNVELEDGFKGFCYSRKQEGMFKDGDDVEYTSKQDKKGNNVASLKDPNKSIGGGYKWVYNEELQHQSFKLTAIECSLILAEKFNIKADSKVMKAAFDWIVKSIGSDPTKQDCMNAPGCITRAFKSIGLVTLNTPEKKGQDISTIDEVLDLATMYLGYVKGGGK